MDDSRLGYTRQSIHGANHGFTLGLFRYSDKNLNVNPKIRTAGRRAVADPDGPDGRLRTILLIIDFGILSTVYLFVRDFSNFITIHDSRVDS